MPTERDFRRLDSALQRLYRERRWLFEFVCVTLGTALFLAAWLVGRLLGGK
jgi:hypothetical protein